MAQTFAKDILSSSTDGKAILVAATATAGTEIHTGSSSTSVLHEVWLYANNVHTANVDLTVEWGAATSGATNSLKVTVPVNAGPMLVIPGLIIKGNATPLTVKAFAGTTNVINVTGYIHTITNS